MSDRPNLPRGDDGDLAETGRRLGDALSRHAEPIEPRHDAYARLAARVNEAGSSASTGIRSILPLPRLAFAVSLVAVAVVGGLAVMNASRDDEPTGSAAAVAEDVVSTTAPAEVLNATTTVGETAAAVAAEPSSSTTAESDGTDDVIGNPGLVVPLAGGIARDSRQAAAEAFLDHLGIDHALVTIAGDEALISTEREGGGVGPEIAVLELVPVGLDDVDRWTVIEARSDAIEIEAPFGQAKVTGEALTIKGRGTGFEGWVDIDVHSATDGRRLVRSGAEAGSLGELRPYEATVPMVGTEHVWVVVTSSSGTDEVASAFAAVPISSVGSTDTATYRVVRIGENDPDDGLNVRSGPGSNNDVVGVLDRGAAVTRRGDDSPRRNGSSVWWPIVTDGGVEGWAASQYLAAEDPLSDESLISAGTDLLRAASNPDSALWVAGSSRLGLTLVDGGTQTEVPAANVSDPTWWTSTEAGLGNRTPAEVINAPVGFEETLTVRVNDPGSVDAATAPVLARYLGGLPYVTVDYTDADNVDQTLHLVYEAAPTGGPALVGIVVP